MPVISSSHSLVLFVSVRGNTVLLDTRTQMFGTIFHCLHAFITYAQVVTNYHYFFLEKFLESSWFGLLLPCVKMYLHLPQALCFSHISTLYLFLYLYLHLQLLSIPYSYPQSQSQAPGSYLQIHIENICLDISQASQTYYPLLKRLASPSVLHAWSTTFTM